jgi:hypothetical protein
MTIVAATSRQKKSGAVLKVQPLKTIEFCASGIDRLLD